MIVETEIEEESVIITITVKKKIGKMAQLIVLRDHDAKKILLEKHPELSLEEEALISAIVNNNKDQNLKGTWKFKKTTQQPVVEEKKPQKKPKTILTFKPKDAKVEETTQPDPEAKGVEEPTE